MRRTFDVVPNKRVLSVWAVAFLMFAQCGGPDPVTTDAGTNRCAKGLKPVGPACEPVFDECVQDEVPLLGGGCKRVGVEECTGGIKGPPNWQCKHIGSPDECLKGWQKLKSGWCEPILPKDPCPQGTMEVIGKATCRVIGDCGSGTWGKIKTSAKTVYVDISYPNKDSDGSKAKPYKTISAALSAVSPGGHIAIASGEYNEDIAINKSVVLEGRCPQMVTVKNLGKTSNATITVYANGVTIRGLRVTGTAKGILVSNAKVVLERLAVDGCMDIGIAAVNADLTIRDSAVSKNTAAGAYLDSSIALFERSVVRDTKPYPSDKTLGIGIGVTRGSQQGSTVTIRESLVDGNRTAGIVIESSTVKVEKSAVRNTRSRSSDDALGIGIQAGLKHGLKLSSRLVIHESIISNNRWAGIHLLSSMATLADSVIVDTQPQVSDMKFGVGIRAESSSSIKLASTLSVQDSLVARNRVAGVLLFGSSATLESSVVRDTESQSSDRKYGMGIQIEVQGSTQLPSNLVVRDSAVVNNRVIGVALYSSTATLERSVVRDTRPSALDQMEGMGIQAVMKSGMKYGSTLKLSDCLLKGNRKEGIVLTSSTATIERSIVRDTKPQSSDKNFGLGISAYVGSDTKVPSSLNMRDSIVANSWTVGVFVGSSKLIAERSVIRFTHPRASDNLGYAIMAGQQDGMQGSTLELRDCMISNNWNVSVMLYRSTGTVERCLVQDTKATPIGFGDGLEVRGKTGTLTISESLVDRSERAGLGFFGSGGLVKRSVFRNGLFSIIVEDGASPKIEEANVFEKNKRNSVSFGRGLKPAPVPDLSGL